MSVRVRGANSPIRILVSNVKSSKSKANLFYLTLRKPNHPLSKRTHTSQSETLVTAADIAGRNVNWRIKCCLQPDLVAYLKTFSHYGHTV